MASALPATATASFREYARNMKWAKSHDAELDRFTGKYVAVARQRVIASGASPEELRPKLRGLVGVYISFVPERGLIWIL